MPFSSGSRREKGGIAMSAKFLASAVCALVTLAVLALATGAASRSFGDNGELASASPGTTTGSWTTTASMASARYTATATRLADGRILVVGGAEVSTAELYDPASGTWSPAGTLSEPAGLIVAVRLADGRVL